MTPIELKRRRQRLRLTQAQLADALGVTWSTVARWETAQRRIPEMAAKLLSFIEGEAARLPRRVRRKEP